MSKKIKKNIIIIFASIATLLGLLWFLQGTAIIKMCPIPCFTSCECILGGSNFWTIIGASTFICGIAALFIGMKKM